MRRILVGALLLLLLAASCGQAPLVVQGTVLSYDPNSKTVTIDDEKIAEQQMVFYLADADMGAIPEAGDIIRVAYRDEGGKLFALRVMNLSTQAELKKKGH